MAHGRSLPFLAMCLGVAAAAAAQVTTADIVGRITDSTGGVLPGATITIENVATHDIRTAPSNETGDYVFNLLPIGAYTVKVELQGFTTQNTRVSLSAGDRVRVDARLQVGEIAENVIVAAESPLLQTDTATVSSLVTDKAVQDLPVSGRNVQQLVQLVPGAFEGLPNSLASGTRPDDRRQTSAISINGALDNQNNQLIDGVDNNERAIGTVGVKPSIDAIAEVKVETNMYTAEVGRTAGGVVNIITKSGTNAFHGSAFEFYRNDHFDARNYFATNVDKPVLHQNQYGGSLGGPVAKSRTRTSTRCRTSRGSRTTTPASATGRRTPRPPMYASTTSSTRTIGCSCATRTTGSTRSPRRSSRWSMGSSRAAADRFRGRTIRRRTTSESISRACSARRSSRSSAAGISASISRPMA